MDPTQRRADRRTRANVVLAVLVGLVVLVLLFPGSGIDTDPPSCFSLLDYGVPCGGGWAVAAGAATALTVGLLLWLADRWTRRR